MSTKTAELFDRTLAYIDAHPEQWNQHAWHVRGSSACFVVWASILAGIVTLDENTTGRDWPGGLAGHLGLTRQEAGWLASVSFGGNDRVALGVWVDVFAGRRVAAPGVVLSRADLSGADLSGADLRWADLYGVDLYGAILTGTDLSGAVLSRADLTDADLTGANLTGANLTKAALTGAILSGTDLSGANLTRANLTDADLTGANLTGANLTKAALTGAILTGTDLSGANLGDMPQTQRDKLTQRGALNVTPAKVAKHHPEIRTEPQS
jgi:Pentapeptide repeats (8 copies)